MIKKNGAKMTSHQNNYCCVVSKIINGLWTQKQ